MEKFREAHIPEHTVFDSIKIHLDNLEQMARKKESAHFSTWDPTAQAVIKEELLEMIIEEVDILNKIGDVKTVLKEKEERILSQVHIDEAREVVKQRTDNLYESVILYSQRKL